MGENYRNPLMSRSVWAHIPMDLWNLATVRKRPCLCLVLADFNGYNSKKYFPDNKAH